MSSTLTPSALSSDHSLSDRAALRCVVVGAPGYSGAELISILSAHPGVRIVGLFGSERRADVSAEESSFSSVFPRLRGVCDLPVRATSIEAISELAPDVVFLATPHAASHDLAPALVRRGVTVFDLSAAFRLGDPALYPSHYGFTHAHTDLLESAVYGIPELNRAQIAKANLIACAGCYPTSAILPLEPLARAGAIAEGRPPIVDSTSGVSGAGRKPLLKVSFCEVSLQSYDVFEHRHNPEIDRHAKVEVIFTPHLVAFDRGILSTIHVDLAPGWTEPRIRELYSRRYAHEPFVRLLPKGEWPAVSSVRGTNFCDIAFAVDDRRRHLIISSAIDNLGKGASGQAVQCLNARFGFPETLALLAPIHEVAQ